MNDDKHEAEGDTLATVNGKEPAPKSDYEQGYEVARKIHAKTLDAMAAVYEARAERQSSVLIASVMEQLGLNELTLDLQQLRHGPANLRLEMELSDDETKVHLTLHQKDEPQ